MDLTPLHTSAKNGDDQMVGDLIKAKVELNPCLRFNGATPLYLAAKNGMLNALNFL